MSIYLDQAGYFPAAGKSAAALQEGGFKVYDSITNKAVYEGKTEHFGMDEASGDDVHIIDFTDVKVPGTYYIQMDAGAKSCVFPIAEDVYKNVKKDMLKAFYYQRCGQVLSSKNAGVYAHDVCHTKPVLLYENSDVEKEMSGGWHDAGDYGRYTTPAAVAVAHLLYAFELFPESFREQLNIPESGNGIPDVLNECRYELEWLLKMQAEDGGVYHKLTSIRHANFVMPEEDSEQLYAFPVSSMATADFAAVMALAYRIYGNYEEAFSEKVRKASKKAWAWLMDHPGFAGFQNPAGCNTGPYDDDSDVDERLWAAAELLRAEHGVSDHDLPDGQTEVRMWLERLSAMPVSKTNFGCTDVSGFAALSVLFDKENCAGPELKLSYEHAVLEEADRLLKVAAECGYGVAMSAEDYTWGSNMVVTNRAILFIAAHLVAGKTEYASAALAQLHYLFGKNATGYSYVTGHGGKAFRNPHNRPTVADAIEEVMPGWVSGGPNGTPCDEKAEWIIKRKTPPMKCYADVWECYSLNEITIYWNSSAVFAAAYFDKN